MNNNKEKKNKCICEAHMPFVKKIYVHLAWCPENSDYKQYEKKPWYTKVLNYLVAILLSLFVVYITYRILRKYL